jgi:hypothetical protein
MKAQAVSLKKPSLWQLIFLQSKVNGAAYFGERLPGHNWNWPKNTYFQRRLQQVRLYRSTEPAGTCSDLPRQS